MACLRLYSHQPNDSASAGHEQADQPAGDSRVICNLPAALQLGCALYNLISGYVRWLSRPKLISRHCKVRGWNKERKHIAARMLGQQVWSCGQRLEPC